MKRYIILGERFNLEEYKNGEVILYDDFINLIKARIEELEQEIDNEYSIYSEGSCRFRIEELKRLIE